ncbi:cdc42 effector protein 2 isoform X1 [Cyprinus carpio]|uniref:Cdc42 effector protein 2 isoform X1 n=2 Tax=Cyprinus carpio TaxID=7962 RepID=A0A9Q9ZZZ7_CYPCA|nr:cdc42 effector protein 2 isoform X1 [Cyprinus carpio]XP_042580297.1 cdc42 effector protein 2 isoform X1 [Cyprinus carpio]
MWPSNFYIKRHSEPMKNFPQDRNKRSILTLSKSLSLCCSGGRGGTNMSAKAPIYLKRRSRKGKKEKLRDLLSSDMISPPLGDFRHTIHIGSGGGADDLFGDLSFLQGKFHLLPGQEGHQGSFQLSRTASVSSHPPAYESSPLLKNALSLPIIGGVQALTLPAPTAPLTSAATAVTEVPTALSTTQSPPTSPSLAPPPKPPRLHLEERSVSRHTSLPASPNRSPHHLHTHKQSPDPEENEKCVKDGDQEEKPYLSNAGSMLSLHLDLGPSILEDVLQIMDNQRTGTFSGRLTPSGRQQIYT